MAYTTQNELIERYGAPMMIGLTDRAEVPTGAVDATVVTRAIEDAQALIDGYLAKRVTLPLSETPPLVAKLAAEIAIYNLHTGGVSDKVEEDHKAAVRTLQDISKGHVHVPGTTGVEPEGKDGTGAQMTDRPRPMDEAGMKGFI